MDTYRNLGRNSGVIAYEVMNDSISVQFHDGAIYLYSYRSAGVQNIEHMKKLAIAGRGLNSFINQVVKKKYASKLK